MKRKKIFITGATGVMGREGLARLLEYSDLFEITVFSLPTKKDKRYLSPFLNRKLIKVKWGSLIRYEDVYNALDEVDVVLHLGALVSPKADKVPRLTWETNVGGTNNLIKAIKERGIADRVKFVYIGSVAETGSRLFPLHWGRVGDPVFPSLFDHYALSKIAAEREVIESGLKFWVSLRQTGILHDELLRTQDGIAYHQPLNNCMEWITASDSGRLLLNLCLKDLSDSFWNKVYNIGGGPACRITAFDFYHRAYELLGLNFVKVTRPNWFALKNFHGQWFLDSEDLELYLCFRSESLEDGFNRITLRLPLYFKYLKYLPAKWVSKYLLRNALKGDTPLKWIKEKDEDKISAFLGSLEIWKEIPDWNNWSKPDLSKSFVLNHGYDEFKSDLEIGLEEVRDAAHYRGGKVVSTSMKSGDIYKPLTWECGFGHRFNASPYLILKAGHWCKSCLQFPIDYEEHAKVNPFLAQVIHPKRTKKLKSDAVVY